MVNHFKKFPNMMVDTAVLNTAEMDTAVLNTAEVDTAVSDTVVLVES